MVPLSISDIGGLLTIACSHGDALVACGNLNVICLEHAMTPV